MASRIRHTGCLHGDGEALSSSRSEGTVVSRTVDAITGVLQKVFHPVHSQ